MALVKGGVPPVLPLKVIAWAFAQGQATISTFVSSDSIIFAHILQHTNPSSNFPRIRVFALQVSHFKIPRALDFFLGNSRNLRQLFEISAGFGKSKQEISNFPSHSRIIWGVKLRKIEN